MNKAYKYRIYPNEEQKIKINKNINGSRFVYNQMLGDRINHYKLTKQMLKTNPSDYKKPYPWLKECDSLALANAWTNLNTAYNNFFKHKSGFPKFKSKKKSKWSYTTNNNIPKRTIRIENHKIKLPKIDFIKLKYHREIPKNSTIKSVTVTRTRTDKYYVSVLVEYDNQVLTSIPHSIIGLDYSMSNIYVDSNGNKPTNITKFLKDFDMFEKKLAKANRSLARKKKFSKNFYKQVHKLHIIYEKFSNKKLDFLHKISKELTDTYDCIVVEDISVKTMAKRKKGKKFSYGKQVSRNAWGTLTTMFEYKLYWKGKVFTKIDKYFASSQLCSNCGSKNPQVKDLSIREWTCPTCGAHHDRDINAAKNILAEGKRINKIE